MIVRLRFLLLAALLPLIAGCSESGKAASPEANPPWKVERKYYLKDCIVKVDLLWPLGTEHAEKSRVMHKVAAQVNRAVVSGKLPMFSGGTTRELAFYVFYYADKCEQRKALTQKLIDEFFVPNVPQFPPYKIIDKGIEPGFDGVMPSGLWLDH